MTTEPETPHTRGGRSVGRSDRAAAAGDGAERVARGRSEVASVEAERDAARAELAKATERLRRRDQRIASLTASVQREKAAVHGARAELVRLRTAAEAPPPVFFIVGQAKSGTSWVMRMLDAHPEVLARGEGRFFGSSYKRADVKRMESKTLQPSSLHRALLDADYLRSWVERSVWTRDGDTNSHLDELTQAATVHFLTAALEGSEARMVGDKTPFLSPDMLAELASICPTAKVIHVIRDGRDVAVSAMHHLWNHQVDLGGGHDLTAAEMEIRDAYRADPDGFRRAGRTIFTPERVALLAEAWGANVSRAMADGPRLLGPGYTEVRFEALASRTLPQARRLFGFLGVDSRATVARPCVDKARFERWSKGRKRGTEDSSSFFRKGIVGDWRNFFTDGDDSIFQEEAGDLLRELGYDSGASS
jgi:Sulfotransferase domain